MRWALTNGFLLPTSRIISQCPVPTRSFLTKYPANTMASVASVDPALSRASFVLRPSGDRGHADHGWLNTYHTFSFANYYDPKFEEFGSLRVLNEDRVAPHSGFPFHRHANFEIFSYILSGELTHRDSMHGLRAGQTNSDKGTDFFVMKRGDVQFTTGGTGIAHSETNEGSVPCRFLQIWVKPDKKDVSPRYHSATFSDDDKRKDFVKIISPLVGGVYATEEQDAAAKATLPDTIPIHADFMMGAGLIPAGEARAWTIGGGDTVEKRSGRHVYVHLTMSKQGSTQVEVAGRSDCILKDGDGVFISNVNAGDVVQFKSVGKEEAELVILDSE